MRDSLIGIGLLVLTSAAGADPAAILADTGEVYLRELDGVAAEARRARDASFTLAVGSSGDSDLLHPGERVIRVIEVRADEGARAVDPLEEPEGELVVRNVLADGQTPAAARLGVIRSGVLVTPDGTKIETESYIPSARGEGRDLVIPAPLGHDHQDGARYLLVNYAESAEWKIAPELLEDPLDTAPLGDRKPVVLIHGLSSKDLSGEHDPEKLNIWNTLRGTEDYTKLFARYKFYLYRYPTFRHVKENGESLVALLEQHVGTTALRERRVILIGHSMGGLVMRWALNHQGFGQYVSHAITGATPHHGAGGASLIYANWRIAEKVGLFWATVIRFAKCFQPDSPGLRSLAWDNFDGAIPGDEAARYGLLVNTELRALNESDPWLGKYTTLMGAVTTLQRPGDLVHRGYDLVREGQGTYAATFGTSDPLVPLSSGTLAGDSRHEVMTYENFDHSEIFMHSNSAADVLTLLRAESVTTD